MDYKTRPRRLLHHADAICATAAAKTIAETGSSPTSTAPNGVETSYPNTTAARSAFGATTTGNIFCTGANPGTATIRGT